jgi:hypothetical protein
VRGKDLADLDGTVLQNKKAKFLSKDFLINPPPLLQPQQPHPKTISTGASTPSQTEVGNWF